MKTGTASTPDQISFLRSDLLRGPREAKTRRIRQGFRHLVARRLAAALGLGLGLALATASGTYGADADQAGSALPHLVDAAGLLTPAQAGDLEARLDAISAEHSSDVVVVAVESFGWRSPEAFADDYFDYGPNAEDPAEPGNDSREGYGVGPERSGILLAIAVGSGYGAGTRDAHVSTTGEAIEVFTDSRLQSMIRKVRPYLSADDWSAAFNEFADQVASIYTKANRFRWEVVAGGGLAAGLVGGFIPVTVWRRQLKSVRPAVGAKPYLQTHALVLTTATERFVGESTRVIDMSSSSGSGGGSSTHRGSSGISHGGASFKF